MRLGAIVGVVIAFVGLLPATASAICGAEPPVRVWPHYGGLAPTNAQIVVQGATIGGSLKLVTAPRAQARTTIPLTPSAGNVFKPPSLDPNTSYELRDGADHILGFFATGSLADTAPPSWPGVTKAIPPKPPAKGADLECMPPALRLEGPMAATDDLTSRADIRYALWLGKTLDYASPPTTFTTVPSDFGKATTFTLTYELDLPKDRPLKLAVKAIDLAGNASPASELTLP